MGIGRVYIEFMAAPHTAQPRTSATIQNAGSFPTIVETWGEFFVTISWTDRDDSETVLRSTTLEAAKVEAAKIRSTSSEILDTFAGIKLRYRVVTHATIDDSAAYDA